MPDVERPLTFAEVIGAAEVGCKAPVVDLFEVVVELLERRGMTREQILALSIIEVEALVVECVTETQTAGLRTLEPERGH